MKIIVEIIIKNNNGKFKPQVFLHKNDQHGGESQEVIVSQWLDTNQEAEDLGKLVGKEESFKKYGKNIGINFLLK